MAYIKKGLSAKEGGNKVLSSPHLVGRNKEHCFRAATLLPQQVAALALLFESLTPSLDAAER